jgi:type IV pilus assembly protein PilM
MALFYKDKPVFGIDIGRNSVKLMQIDQDEKKPTAIGYGSASFDPKAIERGVIIDHESVVKAIYELMTSQIVGRITTDRVAVSIPNAYSFSRSIVLPKMETNELQLAVKAEAEQSIPMPIDDLYFDFTIARQLDDGTQEIQLVACPKVIIDSYNGVFDALGLTVALFESNIAAVTRMVVQSEEHDVTTLIVDFGSTACDLSIYDSNTIRITGTVDCSGENITNRLAEVLGVSKQQAHSIKTRYGLQVSKKQSQILSAVEPEINKLINEIRKVVRYFSDRAGKDVKIGQIIILGGGANLPGLSGYITDKTRIPTRLCAPWNNLTFGKLQPPHELETTLYTTAGGLSLISPKELSV